MMIGVFLFDGGVMFKKQTRWLTKQQRKAYHRIASGIYYRSAKGWRLRFLTLTLKEGSKNDIHECFRVLKERIRRKFKDFEYFSVKILDSRPHMHLVYFGSFMLQKWLRSAWYDITGDSFIVDIRSTREEIYDAQRLAGYCIGQYVTSQEGKIRFSKSKNWLPQNWREMWKKILKACRYNFKKVLLIWHSWLLGYDVSNVFYKTPKHSRYKMFNSEFKFI
jgi:hypothetical protein